MTNGEMTHDLSMMGLFLQADPIVKAVMALLVLASIACWAVVIDKALLYRRLGQEVRSLTVADPAALSGARDARDEGLAARVLRAGGREWAEGRDEAESRGEFRDRMERAMRAAFTGGLRGADNGLQLLATVGAVGPFVGLFGTVWGIMNSFSSIAQSQDTSLAVVAPGIAEALLATAIGLVAAIPAVMAYNRLALRLGRLRADGIAAIGGIGATLARRGGPQIAHQRSAA
ncbi:MotA/TolQ/ExbB proton channel family protein [Humitalea sp. 24SJ18S-53]|uniref:MotA/TolQ/ExbB proton channel family protein n=1 Tax=Humitalea sp. 24SJ18S-53 TaxID=3422307 RepID=UPI003D671C34